MVDSGFFSSGLIDRHVCDSIELASIFHCDPVAYLEKSPALVASMLRRSIQFFDDLKRED